MPGAIDEGLAQQAAVIVDTVHDILIGGFVLDDDQAITFGVQGEDGNINLSIENNILLRYFTALGFSLMRVA